VSTADFELNMAVALNSQVSSLLRKVRVAKNCSQMCGTLCDSR